MEYIKKRFDIIDSKILNENKTYKINTISDICVAMSLINPDFLSPILDKGLISRYTQNNTVFLNDLKTILFKNEKLKIGKKENSKVVIDDDISVANKIFNMNEFDIQKDWNILQNARNLARNIYDKLLLNEKLTKDMIKYVYWLTPNKDTYKFINDMTIELTDGRQFNITVNKSFNTSGSMSFATLSNVLMGDNTNIKLYSDVYLEKWNKLIQEWVRLNYESANTDFRVHIEKFVSSDRISSITYNNYYEVINKDDTKKILGEEVNELDKNYTHLCDLLSDMYKNQIGYNNFEEFNKTWIGIKKVSLNSNIIEDLIYNEFELIDAEEKEKNESGKIKAKGKLKLNFVKLFADLIKANKFTNRIYFTNTKHYNIPSRTHIKENYDKFDIMYKIHHTVSNEDIEEGLKDDFEISFDVYYNSEIVTNIKIFIGYVKEMDKLSAKYKLITSSDFNYKTNI